ncbi:uncharacterized protein N7484_006892 [Penicillium longicatenatum]|uniref:uncharacterized protein n=1 Tax=Penicillium longicatenatum TaxID=1561947 RepID=UPI0025480AE0|nr:uncharacterized protein N7484_006892 [Penicillium longicatenatum]KAJ5639030.1 hypothetical protein N7484_006892 [Penicillium longicatenatum]
MAAAGARAQKPVGSAAWIAAEKENMAELVEQEMEEVEYPVRHEMDWLNEHMAEIFSKGQTNFTDIFKTPGKMRGKTPRTARKRNVEESRVVMLSRWVPSAVAELIHCRQPLSEIFTSTHKQSENRASPSPFIHRVISRSTAATTSASPRPKDTEKEVQPHHQALRSNLNSFQTYNTDSGYHGMEDYDDVVLPDTQPNTQDSTQPMEVEEPTVLSPQVDIPMSHQVTEDSFHSAQENVRSRGETVEPTNVDPAPTQERTTTPPKTIFKEPEQELEMSSTPTPKTQPKAKESLGKQGQQEKSADPQESHPQAEAPKEPQDEPLDEPVPQARSSPAKTVAAPVSTGQRSQEQEDTDLDMEDDAKEDTVLDSFDDIGSPSDNSTPERPFVRKSSLSFASLPAREPLTKSIGASRLSRTSHIDLPKLTNAGRPSYLGRQTGSHKTTQVSLDDNIRSSGSMDLDDEKNDGDSMEAEKASKIHSTKSTQSLHERISMLGKAPPSRPKKSIAAPAVGAASAGQVAYPELPATKIESRSEATDPKARDIPTSDSAAADEDDWIPQRPTLEKSKTADVMENVQTDKNQSAGKKDAISNKEKHSAEPERPKSSYSIFSSPRPQGHQQSASTSYMTPVASTTPTGSPRRYDGPISASKIRLQSIMKSAKGLFTSTGSSVRIEPSSPEQPRAHPKQRASAERVDEEAEQQPQPRHLANSPRQEGRRTRSSTEKEQKQRQKELEDRQVEESRQEKAREQERQRAIQLKAAQDKSSVEPEERTNTQSHKPSQSLRTQSREPESAPESSRIAMSQAKQNDRRPKPTREPMQKPKPQPVSVRVGSTLSRAIPMPTASSNVQEANAPAPASKPTTLKKKASNNSLHTASSTSSFKSSVSSQTQAQRKAQLASERKREQEERKREQEERKREQEEREARRKEEQRREQERKRALQLKQQEEARRQAESRAEADRERREQSAQEDSQRAANKQAIEKWRMENMRRQEPGVPRPASRLGSLQPYGRSINTPASNPAKPPKRVMDEEAGHRAAVSKPSNVQPSGEAKRVKTDDEQGQPVRTIGRPVRPPSTIRKEYEQPSISMFGQSGMGHQGGSSVLKIGQPQRPGPGHPLDMSSLANGKIPFAEPNRAPPPSAHKPAPSSVHRNPAQPKPSPKYPSGDSIHLPEIATDSEDEDDSDSEMFPVPKWAQAKELNDLLVEQDGMEVDSIFGPIAPFSLEETFKADKKIKKYRDRTSSANWSGPDGLTQEEIRKDVADRQKLRRNGGWSFNA